MVLLVESICSGVGVPLVGVNIALTEKVIGFFCYCTALVDFCVVENGVYVNEGVKTCFEFIRNLVWPSEIPVNVMLNRGIAGSSCIFQNVVSVGVFNYFNVSV